MIYRFSRYVFLQRWTCKLILKSANAQIFMINTKIAKSHFYCSSPPITNPHTFSTERMKDLFKKVRPFVGHCMAIPPDIRPQVCSVKSKEKILHFLWICWSYKSADKINIGSAIRKPSNCHICRRSANIKNCVNPANLRIPAFLRNLLAPTFTSLLIHIDLYQKKVEQY